MSKTEVERSLIGRGKYVLRPHYRSWQIEESKWFAMSTKQREQQLKKFTNASLVDVSLENSDADPPITIGRNCGTVSGLSVCVDDFAEAVRVPRNCLDGIWHKALELIKTNGAIVSAPDPGFEGNAKYVLSYHGKKPHLVLPKKNGTFSCDGECPNWKSMGICAHCVAAAETCNKLSEFIAWYKKSKKAPSLSKFAEATTAPATGNVKMKRVCFRTKRVCFSSANVGVVFSLSLETRRVTVSALFCILMDNPWYTKGFSIRDILHAMLEEEIFVSNKTWYIYCLLRKYCTA